MDDDDLSLSPEVEQAVQQFRAKKEAELDRRADERKTVRQPQSAASFVGGTKWRRGIDRGDEENSGVKG